MKKLSIFLSLGLGLFFFLSCTQQKTNSSDMASVSFNKPENTGGVNITGAKLTAEDKHGHTKDTGVVGFEDKGVELSLVVADFPHTLTLEYYCNNTKDKACYSGSRQVTTDDIDKTTNSINVTIDVKATGESTGSNQGPSTITSESTTVTQTTVTGRIQNSYSDLLKSCSEVKENANPKVYTCTSDITQAPGCSTNSFVKHTHDPSCPKPEQGKYFYVYDSGCSYDCQNQTHFTCK